MNRKNVILLLTIITFFNLTLFSQSKDKVNKVVIDAGHGGTMPGCVGKKSKEKDITLAVALKFGKLIEKNCPEVKVIYTRKTDVTVEVFRRAEIANDHKADLFISIHCNASENRGAHGVETFVMGLQKSEASIAIAKKENADILLEKNYKENYGGFDPNSAEASVIFSLYSTAYLKNSAILASKVQNHLLKNTQLADRKVQQAGFWVLYKVAMPSILVELGFLSNKIEEEFLIKESTQDIMAISLYNAFIEYKNQIEGTKYPLLFVPNPPDKEPEKSPIVIETPKEPQTSVQNDTVLAIQIDTTPAVISNTVVFKVQFLTTPQNIDVKDKQFKEYPKVQKYFEKNLWKFTAGEEIKFEDAAQLLKKMKIKYPDAFIVAFKNGHKIPMSEARP
ncbi:MAG: N-acetylmuramoyl-L-alanine amidase [Bacteroidetes bacterium HGW-Bacteroidetes-20]|nr:MAG: N-acetylmuramoyl-L-alanine amidase [Bacteroidetes bacterium HGW-Bacteroidetes-20]